MSKHNHLLYFNLSGFAQGTPKNTQQITKNYARFDNHFPLLTVLRDFAAKQAELSFEPDISERLIFYSSVT